MIQVYGLQITRLYDELTYEELTQFIKGYNAETRPDIVYVFGCEGNKYWIKFSISYELDNVDNENELLEVFNMMLDGIVGNIDYSRNVEFN